MIESAGRLEKGFMEDYSLDELRCTIYVEFNNDRVAIQDFFVRVFGGVVKNFTVIYPYAEFSISQNRPPGYPLNDRVFDAKYRIEVVPVDARLQKEYIEFIGSVLVKLWRLGIDAAAVATFEEYLPEDGGYRESPLERWRIG